MSESPPTNQQLMCLNTRAPWYTDKLLKNFTGVNEILGILQCKYLWNRIYACNFARNKGRWCHCREVTNTPQQLWNNQMMVCHWSMSCSLSRRLKFFFFFFLQFWLLTKSFVKRFNQWRKCSKLKFFSINNYHAFHHISVYFNIRKQASFKRTDCTVTKLFILSQEILWRFHH